MFSFSAIFRLKFSYSFLELVSSVLVALEQVEAGAARAQQHGVSRNGVLVSGLYGVFGACHVYNLVNLVCKDWLGITGAVLAMLGVVAAPITSGDTAFRSGRLIVAEWLKLDQRPIAKRLYICVPLFCVSIAMLIWQIENPDGFNTIWQFNRL